MVSVSWNPYGMVVMASAIPAQECQVSCSNQIISSKGDLLCTYYLPKHSDKVTELIAKGMMLGGIPQS